MGIWGYASGDSCDIVAWIAHLPLCRCAVVPPLNPLAISWTARGFFIWKTSVLVSNYRQNATLRVLVFEVVAPTVGAFYVRFDLVTVGTEDLPGLFRVRV